MASPEQLTPRSGRVRHARRLATRRFRVEHGEFLAEGPQAVREALSSPDGTVLEVFATREATERHPDLARSAHWRIVSPEVVAAVCETVHPQGVVARCRFLDRDLAEILAARPRLLVICADVRDPGNAGTVVRCADAAGADAVVFTGNSVDPYNPKAVRAAAGSLFHVALAVVDQAAAVVDHVRSAGLTVLAADGAAELTLPQAAERGLLDQPTGWLLGNEAWGIPPELGALADHMVAVPIYGRAESLNLATAAAVCLYASATAQRARP